MLLALRALAPANLEVHLVAPNHQFVYQPLAVAAAFGLAETHLLELAEIAGEKGAKLHVDSLAGVEIEERCIRLGSGSVLAYDFLVVAVGARRREWLEGALHFTGAADVAAFRALLDRFESGFEQRLCFAGPPEVNWTLPLYELALLTASRLADLGVIGVDLTIATPEPEPLAVFGPAASRMLHNLLADRGIALKVGVRGTSIEHGRLHLDPPATLEVDRVVTLAQLEGPAVAGMPCDQAGFLAVDEHSRVVGLEDVYAAGDGTSSPVRQGGIATQQADAAAEAIAAQLGAIVTPSPIRPTLRGLLLTGVAPAYLRAQIAGTGDSFEVAANPLWWPPSKIAARHLAAYLIGHGKLAEEERLEDRLGPTRNLARIQESQDEARRLALTFAEHDAAGGHFQSALEWLEVIERLDGVLPPGYLHKRASWQSNVRK